MVDNSKTQNKETQDSLNAKSSLELLMNGNKRFLNQDFLKRDYKQQIADTSGGQWPHAIVLSCIDSRVPTETIFDQGIGDIFNAKVAGNTVNEDILASMEYACKYAGSKLVMVLGHTACGAIKGACDGLEDGNLTALLGKFKSPIANTKTADGEKRDSSNSEFVNNVVHNNVLETVANVSKQSAILKELNENGSINIVGAIYDVKTGEVKLVN
jgi:carbonic anhydrase